MNGQWLGRFTGSNTGVVIINVDDKGRVLSHNFIVFLSTSKRLK